MAEPKIETEVVSAAEETKSRFQSFTTKYPRIAKVVGFTALAAATLGALQLWKNRTQNSDSSESDDVDDSFDTSTQTA